ncbi:MAG: tetratricopeptide repeat protein [Methylobacillus sp.]|jgi:predicted negative regulator of RcsB-dependent stress response|nr:tetratricopeptide repeat protein [Methylobacillus sp.]
MAYDLEEQEQLDNIKAWWQRYGNLVTWVLIAVFGAIAAWQYWNHHQRSESLKASTHYEMLSTMSSARDIKEIRATAGQIIEQYPGTPYAGRAALLAAKANYENNDAKSAKAQLEWAMKNATETSVRAIAQLQLAAIQFDEKAYDDALKTLGEKHEAAYDGLIADLKGDVLAAQDKRTEAKAAYAEALTKLEAGSRLQGYTQHKLDALGD